MHHEGWVPYGQPNGSHKVSLLRFKLLKRSWRRGPGSNRRIKVLQTSPLPLGYRALGQAYGQFRPIPPCTPSIAGCCGMERETRLELATLALARRCSTTELLPLDADSSIPGRRNRVKPAASPRNGFCPPNFRRIPQPRGAPCAD